MDMESFEVLFTPTESEWVKVTHRRSLTTICRPAYFVEPTQILPHPGRWVLAGLYVKSFNVMTPDNDCISIPPVIMLEAGLRDRIRKRGVGFNPNSLFRRQRRYTELWSCSHIHLMHLQTI